MTSSGTHDSGITFDWNLEEFEQYVQNCDYDDGVQLALQHLPKGEPILEAGCGMGQVVEYLHLQGYDVTGVEINQETVQELNRHKPHLKIFTGDITHLAYPDNSFGGILSYGVVEHFRTGLQAPLQEQLRVLQPGGIMVITVPSFNLLRRIRYRCSASAQWMKHLFSPSSTTENRQGHNGFLYHPIPRIGEFFEYWLKPAEFETEIRQAGFKILHSLPTHHMTGLWSLFGQSIVQNRKLHFVPTVKGRLIHTLLSPLSFSHNFMHTIIATKPENSP